MRARRGFPEERSFWRQHRCSTSAISVPPAGSVGVPSVTTATTSLGTLSGSGSATQNSQMLSSAAGIGAAGNANASQMLDDVMTKWLDVKVIDFILDDEGGA